MNMVFADFSYLVALELEDDQSHHATRQHWNRLGMQLPKLVVTSFILGEVVTFLKSRHLHSKAVQIGNTLLHSSFVDFVHVDAPLLMEGWTYFEHHQDKDYSLTDCISFVVMRKRKTSTAFAFDKHFQQAGFQVEP